MHDIKVLNLSVVFFHISWGIAGVAAGGGFCLGTNANLDKPYMHRIGILKIYRSHPLMVS